MSRTETTSEKKQNLGPRLRWYQKLEFKVSVGFLVILLTLVVSLFGAGVYLLRPQLENHQEEIIADRSGAALKRLISNMQQIEAVARSLTVVAQYQPQNLSRLATNLLTETPVKGLQRASVFYAPYTVDRAQRLIGKRWAIDGKEVRALPDYRENYLSDIRYAIASQNVKPQCNWSSAYVDDENRPTVACSMAFGSNKRTAGVVIFELQPQSLLGGLSSNSEQYFSLLDSGLAIVAAPSNLGATLTQNVAVTTLAPFQPLLERIEESPVRAATDRGVYEATQVSAVAALVPAMPRTKVERLLLGVWNPWANAKDLSQPRETVEVERDPWHAKTSVVSVFHVPGAYWWLLSSHDVNAATSWLDQPLYVSFAAAIGACVLMMALMFALLQRNVLLPIRDLSEHIDVLARDPDSRADLDSSARNELGIMAHWFNERSTSAREALDRATGAEKQIALEQKANESSRAKLEAERSRTKQVLDATSDAVVFADAAGNISYMNAAARLLTGNDDTEVVGKELSSVVRIFETASQKLLADLPQQARAEKWSAHLLRDIVLLDRLGEEVPVVAHVSTVVGDHADAELAGAALVIRRVSQRASSTTKASADAQRDKLTGLFDRTEFDRQFRELLADARSGAGKHGFLFVETDNFRELNDQHGNHVGDALLHQISEVLETTVGSSGAVFRMRGTQFGVLVPDVDDDSAARLAEEIRHTTASTEFSVGELTLKETLSVGVLNLDNSSKGPIEMYRLAENTCRSGQNGRENAVNVYKPGVVEGVNLAEEMAWVDRIKTGLSGERFHLTSRAIQLLTGDEDKSRHEIFVQFEDEDGFWVPVESFGETARRYNLSEAIDRWTVQALVEAFAADDQQYDHVEFAVVRISGASLADAGFADFVAETLEKHKVAGNRICLQFGEDSMKARVRRLKNLCERLEPTGCRIAMGKFRGAKAASDLVRQLPVSVLKVAGRTVNDPELFEVLEDIVSLGRELERMVIADDVSDDTALASVKRAGVRYAQGDIIARASPMLFGKGF